MITEDEATAIKRAIRRLVRAEIDWAFKGTQDPIYHDDMEHELKSSKAKLANLLSVNTIKPKEPNENRDRLS